MLISFVLVFSNAEYRIALVDFICSSRGRLERDRGFANPLSLSNTSPHPGVIRCGGAYLLPRAYTNLGSYIPVLSLLPSSEFALAVCVRLCIARVSIGLLGYGRSFFIIGGIGRSCLRLRGGLQWSFGGFARNLLRRLTREWIVSLGG